VWDVPYMLVTCMVKINVFRCRDLGEGFPIAKGDP
jgi:hypothetical protein